MTYAKEGRGEHYGKKMHGDGWQIPLVLGLRHRTANGRHQCPCDECRAIKQVCALAAERLAMPSRTSAAKKPREQINTLRAAIAAFLAAHDVYGTPGDDDVKRMLDYGQALDALRLLARSTEQAEQTIAPTLKLETGQ